MSVQEGAASSNAAKGSISSVLRPIRVRLIAAGVIAAVGSVLSVVPLAGIARIAASILEADSAASDSAISRTLAVSVVSLLAGMLMISAAEWMAHLADNRITGHLRVAIVRRLARVPLGWFSTRASGEIKQAIQDDINTLHSLTAHFYTTLGRAVGVIVASVIYLFAMDWRMAIVSLLPFPLFFVFFARATRASSANMQAFGARMASINNALSEFVNGIAVIKTFGAQGRAHQSYREAVDGFAQAFDDFTKPLVSAMANANAMIAPAAVLGVVLAFGTLFVALGWILPVEVLPFALVTPGICAPLLLLKYITHDLNHATGAAQRVHDLLQTPVLETLPGQACQVPATAVMRVEDISYAYDGQPPVLEGISFELTPGTVTAIVGASGSGKSTLARLLLRFFDPTEGRITLGGVDLRQIESAQLYRRVGFVLQEVRLMRGSVRENIALGRPSAGQQAIEEAARVANIHDRILELPRGYDSVIGEDAVLSGGEQQRLSIARAVLLDPAVLVLDEPTAATDAENEVKLQQALSRFARDRTVLVIAHRLDTVMHADRIIVLENGVIREQGRHLQLLASGGRYARLWSLGGYSQDADQDDQKDRVTPC